MKKVKQLYLGLEDLGKIFFIDSVAFGGYNNLGVSGELYINITDEKLCKEFDIPETDLAMDFYLESFDDMGVKGILFTCAKDVFSKDSDYANDSYDDRYTLFAYSEDADTAIPNVHFNNDLIHVLEAYVTIQFFARLGFMPDFFMGTEDVDISDTDKAVLYIKQYLIEHNIETLTKDAVTIKGKDIDYPRQIADGE